MQEQSIFIEALEKEDAVERAAFLDRVCACDPILRQRIEKLLKQDQEAGGFMETPVSLPTAFIDSPLRDGPGTMIGPFKLIEQIGEGGFGLVFLAEQTQPLRRKVAVKITQTGNGQPAGDRPLRSRTRSAGLDGPCKHRPRAGRW